MSSKKEKCQPSPLEELLGIDARAEEKGIDSEVLKPAMHQLGTTKCPVCNHAVAVFLTKTSRPFINCGFCSARLFYNGRESIRLLKSKLRPTRR